MSANVERSSATARRRASVAATFLSNALTLPTAATISRSRSKTVMTNHVLLRLTVGSEFKQMSSHISSLQDQVDQLYANLNALRSQVDAQSVGSMGTPYNGHDYPRSLSIGQTPILPPSPSRQRTKSLHPRFHGPTSSAFNLGVAKSSLKKSGVAKSSSMLWLCKDTMCPGSFCVGWISG